jgi:hypothetical protein
LKPVANQLLDDNHLAESIGCAARMNGHAGINNFRHEQLPASLCLDVILAM